MGADYVGFRSCTLQQSLGDAGFLGKLKLRAYKSAIEAQVPPEKRSVVKIQVQVTGGETRELDYAGICRDLETFQAGSPECASCPLSGGNPVGCYRYVGYPVDAIGEEIVFSYFVRDLDTRDSIQDQLYRDIVSRVPTSSNWHTNRGSRGRLATLERPLSYTTPGGRRVDSAQVLQAMFMPLDHLALVVGYARFFRELAVFIDAERKRIATIRPDGGIDLHVASPEKTAEALERAKALYGSRTLHELLMVGDLVNRIVPLALDKTGRVFVDA